MATIFFKISEEQDREIQALMKEEGYTNKAEFFRFLIKFFKYKKPAESQNIEIATKELSEILKKLDKQGKLNSSIDDQLSDV